MESHSSAQGVQAAKSAATTEAAPVRNGAAKTSAQTQNTFVPHSFSHPIPEKLEPTNFLNWRRQVMVAVKGYRLQKYLLGPRYVPLRFLSEEDEENGEINEDFLNWEQQDSLLFSWLLTSMTQAMTDLVIDCEFSYELWETLQKHFSSKTRAKITQYRTQLRTMEKGSMTLHEYLLQIKKLANALTSVGAPITPTEHIECIF